MYLGYYVGFNFAYSSQPNSQLLSNHSAPLHEKCLLICHSLRFHALTSCCRCCSRCRPELFYPAIFLLRARRRLFLSAAAHCGHANVYLQARPPFSVLLSLSESIHAALRHQRVSWFLRLRAAAAVEPWRNTTARGH
jgi:hypothetical protein